MAGSWSDMVPLRQELDLEVSRHSSIQGRQLTTTSLSRLLSNKLYHNRFRPYYAFNVVAGLDPTGKQYAPLPSMPLLEKITTYVIL